MNTKIKQLVHNPNAVGLDQIRQIRKTDSHCGLDLVLPPEVVTAIEQAQPGILPAEGPKAYPEGGSLSAECWTPVFFWGFKGVGKTTAISALAATEGSITVNSTQTRRRMMTRLFGTRGADAPTFCTTPTDADNNADNADATRLHTQHVIVSRKKSLGRTAAYPVSLIDVDVTWTGNKINIPTLDNYIGGAHRAIHILCLDCSGDVRRQAQMLESITTWLDTEGHIENSSGVFIMVTKIDTMLRVPAEYRYVAAQTLVTAGQRRLWLRVLDCCHRCGVRGATPIPFSVGEFTAQRLFRPDRTWAERLWEYPILAKTMPAPTRWDRLMQWGGKWMAIPALIILGLVGYGLWRALAPDAPYPTERFEPLDYVAWTSDRINHDVARGTWQASQGAWERMDRELGLAHRTRAIEDEVEYGEVIDTLLVSDQSFATLNGRLHRAYAPKVADALTALFRQANWNLASTYRTLDNISLRLYSCGDDEAKQAVTEARRIITRYNREVAIDCPLNPVVTTEAQWRRLCSMGDKWSKIEPYNRLTRVTELRGRATRAFLSKINQDINRQVAERNKWFKERKQINRIFYPSLWKHYNDLYEKADRELNTLNALRARVNNGQTSDMFN